MDDEAVDRRYGQQRFAKGIGTLGAAEAAIADLPLGNEEDVHLCRPCSVRMPGSEASVEMTSRTVTRMSRRGGE